MHRSPTAHTLKSLALLASVTLAACDSSTEPGTAASVRIASPAVAGVSTAVASGLSIAGSNGTLVITDIKMIVDEFELRRATVDDCDDDSTSSSGSGSCGEFEQKLFIADVPLGNGSLTIANDRVPAGTYTAMEFEVKDLLDDDEDNDASDIARINELLTQLRTTYTDWPAGASMMVEGTFTPTGGVAQNFRVYFDAEVEVEHLFDAPLVIDATSTGVVIELRPDIWFKNSDGTVKNLATWNFATFANLVEFEVEFEGGVEIEFEM